MQDQPVTIRKMVEEDLPGNHQLQHMQMEYHLDWMAPVDYDWVASEDSTQRTRNFIDNEDSLALVAEQGDRPVGFLLGKIIPNHPGSMVKFLGELCSLFVHEDVRGFGVGKRLCERFNAFCTNQGVNEITVEAACFNHPTHEFYHRLGYKDYSITMRLKLPGSDD